MKKKTRCREFVIPLRGNRTFLAMRYLLIFLFRVSFEWIFRDKSSTNRRVSGGKCQFENVY